MNMSKRVLTSAIAMVLAGGMGSVSATVLMDTNTGSINFASEATIDAVNGTDLANQGSILDAQVEVGFSIGKGTSKYARFTFNGPLVGTALDAGDFTGSNVDASFSISNGGQVGDDYVIVEISIDAGAAADGQQTDTITFQPVDAAGPVGKMEVRSQATATIDYVLYETAVDAVNETNPLASASATWFGWTSGLNLSCTNVVSERIDVTDPTQFLNVGAGPNSVFSVNLTHATAYTLDGALVDIEVDYFTAGTVITVTGDMTAFGGGGDATLPNDDGSAASMTIAADEQSATIATIADTVGVGELILPMSGDFEVTADGTTEIPAGSYSLSLVDDGDATFDVGTKDLGTCGNLQYSGSTDRLDFALTPDGVFRQFVRVTNPSNTSGDVTVTVYNDSGDSTSFNLGDIAGVASSTLGSNASTGMININDVYAAAQAADATFDHNGGKLRVLVRGEFGDDAVDNNDETVVGRRDDGIYIQGVTVSRDNNAFFQTK